MDTINKRIQYIINKWYNGNTSAFCRSIGVKQPTMNTIIGERKSKPSFDVINAIVTNTNVNSNWLITGEGDTLHPSKNHSINNNIKGSFTGSSFVGGYNTGNITSHTDSNSNNSRPIKEQINESDWEKEVIDLKNENIKLKQEIESLQKQLLVEKERLIKMLLEKK